MSLTAYVYIITYHITHTLGFDTWATTYAYLSIYMPTYVYITIARGAMTLYDYYIREIKTKVAWDFMLSEYIYAEVAPRAEYKSIA